MVFPTIRDRDIQIDELKIEHLPVVLSLYNTEANMRYATGKSEPISLDKLTKEFIKQRDSEKIKFLGVFRYNCLIGKITIQLGFERKIIWLRLIMIDKNYQRQGNGSRAIGLIEKTMAKRNFRTIYISVIKQNKVGINFWYKNAYREVNYVGNKKNIYKMKQKKRYLLMYKELI